MNEPTHLENQLRSWTLRRPSAEIATSLFATESVPEKKRSAFSWNWLAPATAAVFTMLVVFGAHPHSPASLGQADTNLFFASITMDNATSFTSSDSLKTAFNLSKSDLNLEQNVWRSASFESTNRAQTPSSIRSLSVDITNSLTR